MNILIFLSVCSKLPWSVENIFLIRMDFQVGRFSQVEAVSNKTKMFVSCKRRFSVYDFWNDGSARVLIENDSEDDLEVDSEDISEEEDDAELE